MNKIMNSSIQRLHCSALNCRLVGPFYVEMWEYEWIKHCLNVCFRGSENLHCVPEKKKLKSLIKHNS